MKSRAHIFVFTVLLVTSCSTSIFGQTAQSADSEVSVPQEFEHGVFTIKINDVYWKDVLYTKGIALEYQNESTTFRPSGSFLVVEIEIINNGDKPYKWKGTKPPFFRVITPDGIEYALSGNHIASSSDLGQAIIHPGPIINPKMSISGMEIFDVPKGSFELVVYLGKHTSGWNYSLGEELCRFSLNPRTLPPEDTNEAKCPELVQEIEILQHTVDSLNIANSLLKEMLKD